MLLSFRVGSGKETEGATGRGGGVTCIFSFHFFHFKVLLSLEGYVGRAVPGECFELFQQTRNVAPGRERRE